MDDSLVPIAFFAMCAIIVMGLTRIISDGRTRRRLIEAQASPELVAAMVAAPRADLALHETLRWGLLLGAIGVALIVIQFLPFRPNDPIMYGVVLVFASAGLLAYYAVARRMLGASRA